MQDPRGLPAFAGIPTFLHLPWIEDSDALREAAPDVAIVGAPFDVAVTHRPGARFGPRAIRAASNLTLGALHHLALRIEPFDYLTAIDAGDAMSYPGDIERSHDAIRAKLRALYEAVPGVIPFVLGGDHSITYPSASVVADHHDRRVGIVHFDAHADTADTSWGALLSHGTPMRRLIEHGHVAGKNFVQVGLRGYWPPPDVIAWMEQQGMRSHFMSEIEERGFDAVLRDAIEQALDGPDLIYLSVDVDVLDPAFAPGTGTPEPGGLSARELLRAVRQIVLQVELAGLDVVEVAPPYDPAGITAEAAHRVCLEALSALAYRRRKREEETTA
ncbi:MAG: agmatinase [Dehalococcoidia bacterium]|nr:agmatinase [Dehalococcoidia bacterium]